MSCKSGEGLEDMNYYTHAKQYDPIMSWEAEVLNAIYKDNTCQNHIHALFLDDLPESTFHQARNYTP